jgi:uncharacterized protein (TIGR02271 family)
MNPPRTVRVTSQDGVHGTIDTTVWPLDGSKAEVLVQLEDGQQVLVPLEALIRQDDGGYDLCRELAGLARGRGTGREPGAPPLVLPVIEEALEVQRRRVETGRVRIHKIVHEREELVDAPLLREEVVDERVPINRVVDAPLPVRYEGDTMIVSILEEVLVVEKRLLLKEEVHITTRRTETYTPERVTLRSEEVIIARATPDDQGREPQPRGGSHGEDRHQSL